MRSAFQVFLLFLLPGAAAFSQALSLELSSVAVEPGGTTLDLTLTSATGSGPAGLQWALTYPDTTVETISATAGPALKDAAKTLACANKTGNYTCIASGMNKNAISGGVVAVVKIQVSKTAPVSITNPVAAAADGKSISISVQGGAVTVVPKNRKER